MSALIERIEAATVEMQSALLEEAWEACAQASAAFRRFTCAHCSGFGTNASKFSAALEAHAFESAAIMLVPEGLHFSAQTDRDGAHVSVGKADSDARGTFYTKCQHGDAKTLAMAICAAALKAGGEVA